MLYNTKLNWKIMATTEMKFQSQDYNVLGSFTQLITAPTCVEENLQV